MKYVVCKKGPRTVIRLFMGAEPHVEIGEEFRALGLLRKVQRVLGVGYQFPEQERGILSAGFVGIDANGLPYAYGESDSLGLKADPVRDTPLLRALWRQAAMPVAMDPP